MEFNLAWRTVFATFLSCALMGCATSYSEFRKNPHKVSKAALCRTFIETRDQGYLIDLTAELARRGINPLECHQMVQQQNQAAAAVVGLALIGTAVAVCANNNCGRPYYPAYSGSCQYEWQYDSRGRRCGRRAASYRAGGW
ncbi:hypothetical protein BSY16_4069 (plasmid) [Sinorhizobium sp. RAC02]|nr:hypothetical protein BSY16_4069 [Sinorhizobium sp. RAC02]